MADQHLQIMPYKTDFLICPTKLMVTNAAGLPQGGRARQASMALLPKTADRRLSMRSMICRPNGSKSSIRRR
jgi:hypothetical protein